MVFPQYIQLLVHMQVSTVHTQTQISLGRGRRCNSRFITRYQSQGFDPNNKELRANTLIRTQQERWKPKTFPYINDT